uniref:(northern house mosquito) hypothetical protein n=1 Tax=Culex pipiens TaxID=7175 RepID=A0A8D8GA98_CULPI
MKLFKLLSVHRNFYFSFVFFFLFDCMAAIRVANYAAVARRMKKKVTCTTTIRKTSPDSCVSSKSLMGETILRVLVPVSALCGLGRAINKRCFYDTLVLQRKTISGKSTLCCFVHYSLRITDVVVLTLVIASQRDL